MRSIAGNTRPFVALAGAVLLLGIADSMAGAYLVLFASRHAGLTPVQIGLFTAAPAAGGIVVATLIARRFDRRPTRGYAIGAATLGALGLTLLTTTRSAPLLIVIAAFLLGAHQAVFPQLFALARVVTSNERTTPLLRSFWSLAWALGPLAGAVMLGHLGFPGLLRASAVVLALAALTTAAVPAPRPTQPQAALAARPDRPCAGAAGRAMPAASPPGGEQPAPHRDRPPGAGLWIRLRTFTISRYGSRPPTGEGVGVAATTGVILFFLAMFAGSIALPLYVTAGLHQPDSTVGLLFSACAAVEIIVALGLAVLPDRVNQRLLIAAAMMALAVFYGISLLADDLTLLLAGQVARGIAIAVVSAAGIRYFQDLMRPATARATTLFANATAAGSLLAGALAGPAIQHWGQVTTLVLCGGAAMLGGGVFCIRQRNRSATRQDARPVTVGDQAP
ncbi:MFS transporter [Actinoplanes sp. NPDC049265]|uniref:MFS transporter n=1 Tax=Actinoplanes sp. NPDC049265 TaxID=3363902 RepID=UPI003715F708